MLADTLPTYVWLIGISFSLQMHICLQFSWHLSFVLVSVAMFLVVKSVCFFVVVVAAEEAFFFQVFRALSQNQLHVTGNDEFLQESLQIYSWNNVK